LNQKYSFTGTTVFSSAHSHFFQRVQPPLDKHRTGTKGSEGVNDRNRYFL